MRKSLLTLCLGALALSASAEVTTFVMESAPLCRYPGNGNIVEVPHGFVFTYQAYDALCRSTTVLNKTMVADNVEINSVRLRKVGNAGDFIPETTAPNFYTRCGQMFWYNKLGCLFTPAAGTAITKITMHCVKPGNNKALSVGEVVDGAWKTTSTFTVNAADTTITWTGNCTEPMNVVNISGATVSPMWIEVTTEGTSTQVAVPKFKKTIPAVGKNEKVELSCATEGAQIYYTVDYENKSTNILTSTTDAILYTGPFTLEKDAVVRAIAVKDGMTNSFGTYQEYFEVDDYTFMAEFNFNDYTTLKDEDGKVIAEFNTYPIVDKSAPGATSTQKASIADRPIVDKGAMFKSDKASITLSDSFSGVVELRPDKGAGTTFGVMAPDDYYISSMLLITGYTAGGLALEDGTAGEFKVSPVNAARKIYRNTANDVDVFYAGYKTAPQANGTTYDQQYIDHLYVFIKSADGSGVNGIEVDQLDENAPVEYFNLQGVRVANPQNGIFIKRQGNKAEKLYIK